MFSWPGRMRCWPDYSTTLLEGLAFKIILYTFLNDVKSLRNLELILVDPVIVGIS